MNKLKKILVYADTARMAMHTGVDWAAELAIENGAAVTIMDVVAEVPWYVDAESGAAAVEEERLQRQQVLNDIAESLGERGIAVDTATPSGAPHTAIIQTVLQGGYDLLVKTMMANELSGRLFGSVAQKLLRNCPCPVLLVKPECTPPPDRIVAAVDVQPDSDQQALSLSVLALAKQFHRPGAPPVAVVHAWTLYGEAMWASRLSPEELQERFTKAEGRVATALNDLVSKSVLTESETAKNLIQGNPEGVIPAFLEREKMDLLVIGTMARSGIAGLIVGNTAENILNNVACSVLAVKPGGFVSPIT